MNRKLKLLTTLSLSLVMLSQFFVPVKANDIQDSVLTLNESISSEKGIKTIGKNLLTNPNFDNNLEGWEHDEKTVIATNNPPNKDKSKHYSMDGKDKPYLKQSIVIPESGIYYAKHWVATTAEDAKFVIKNEENIITEIVLTSDGLYHEVTLEFVAEKGDEVELFVSGGEVNGKWTNGDDFYLGNNKEGIEVELPEFDENGNLISNNDFTDGLNGWVTKGGIKASNNPPKFSGLENDSNHYSLNGKDFNLKKYLVIPEDGEYILSQWVASSGSGGKFGVREIGGKSIAECSVKAGGKYHRETLRFSAKAGDQIEIYVTCAGGWTNGDDFFLGLDNKNLIINPGFESSVPTSDWENACIKSDTPFAGTNYSYVDKNHSLTKTIDINKSGYYDFEVFINQASESENSKIEFLDKNGEVFKEIDVPTVSYYERIFLENLQLEKGKLTIRFSSDNSGYAVDDIGLKLNWEESIFASIEEFEIDEPILEKNIDIKAKEIKLKLLYGEDLKNIEVKNIKVSNEASSSIKAGDTIDLSKPYEIKLITKDGKEKIWTIKAECSQKMISMRSSNKQLESFFNWAANKQDQFVMTGQKGKVDDGKKPDAEYIPSYWAGYYSRTAFYSRDFVHQATGAQIGGLDEENFAMFKTFAKNATESRKWYTPWAFNFDGSIYYMDYSNDDWFVREVPAQFELVEKAYNQYLWSGDKRYIEDEDLFNFYTKVVTDFVDLHDDQNPNGIAEGKGHLFVGTATYNERHNDFVVPGDPTIEAADGIACQYAAFEAYANILEARGDKEGAKEWHQKAADLKKYFNEEWSVYKEDPTNDQFVVELSKNGRQRVGFAMETNYFIPIKKICDPGERNDKAIDLILEGLGTGVGYEGAPANIESYTYIPEMLFQYNRNEEAWHWMKYIDSIKDLPHEMAHQGTNGDYPEVSFTAVSNTVEGMMGVSPNAGDSFVATSPRLPSEVKDATVSYINIGDQLIHLTHNGNEESQLTNTSEEPMTWEIRFYGEHDYIDVDGKILETNQKDINGEVVSYVTTEVKSGDTVTAKTSEAPIYYDITVEQSENGTVEVDKKNALVGETVEVNAVANEGYKLSGIKVNGELIEGNIFKMPEESVVVTAEFVAISYNITVEEPENGAVEVDKKNAIAGELVTINAIPNEGYKLSEIKVNGAVIEGNTFKMPNRDVTITIEFEKEVIYGGDNEEDQIGGNENDQNINKGDGVVNTGESSIWLYMVSLLLIASSSIMAVLKKKKGMS